MRHRLSALASLPRRASICPPARCTPLLTRDPCRISPRYGLSLQFRGFAQPRSYQNESEKYNDINSANARPASELNEKITQEEKDHFAKKLREDKGKQIRTPWHREGSDVPPVARQRSAGAMTKGGRRMDVEPRMHPLIQDRQTTYYALSHAQDYPPPYD
jgi:hypothetical protein